MVSSLDLIVQSNLFSIGVLIEPPQCSGAAFIYLEDANFKIAKSDLK